MFLDSTFHRRFPSWLLASCAILSSQLNAQDCECGTRPELKFYGYASALLGTSGNVNMWIEKKDAFPAGRVTVKSATIPSGTIRAATTSIGSKKLEIDTIYKGNVSVVPGSGSEWGILPCWLQRLTGYFIPDKNCGLDLQIRVRNEGETDFSPWRSTKNDPKPQHSTNYVVPVSKYFDFEVRFRDGNSGNGGTSDDPTDESTSVSGANIPLEEQDQAPPVGDQPANVNPANMESVVPIPGAEGSFYSAGSLKLSGTISPTLANKANLKVRNPEGEESPSFDIVSIGGEVRQVMTPQLLVDIQPVSGGGFEIRMIEADGFGTTPDGSGVYPVTGSPANVVRYMPIAASGDHQGGVEITRVSSNGTTRVRQILSTSGDGQSYRVIQDGLEVRNVESTFAYSGGKWTRTDQETVTREGALYAKTDETFLYQVERAGTPPTVVNSAEFLVTEVVYDGAATLATSYEPSSDFIGQPLSVTRPDGSWTKFDYYQGDEAGASASWRGFLKHTFTPWNGLPTSPVGATPSNSKAETLLYNSAEDAAESGVGHTVIETVTTVPSGGGVVTIGKTTSASGSLPHSSLLSLLEDEGGLSANWSLVVQDGIYDTSQNTFVSATQSMSNLSGVYSTQGTAADLWDGRTFATIDSEGAGKVTGFERGDFDPVSGSFTVDSDPATSDGEFIRSITLDVADTTSVPDVLEATKTIEIEDLAGRVHRRELWIRDTSTTWALATFRTFEYEFWDDGSLKRTVEKHNGRVVSEDLQFSGTERRQWDEQGIETRTESDELGRPTVVTTMGVAAGAFAAQADRSTIYSYDGSTITTTVSGNGLQMTTVQKSDLAGRTVSETDVSGAVTRTDYLNDGLDTLVTLPGGLTRMESRDIDGEIKSVTGTSVVDEVYARDVDPSSGNIITTVRTGDVVDSPRYTITETDWAGRTVSEKKPSPTESGEVTTTYTYAEYYGGATNRVAAAASSASGVSPEVSEKPSPTSSVVLSGHDASSDGLYTASLDRVSETQTKYELSGGYWWKLKVSKAYDVNNSSSSAVTEILKTCLHGAPGSAAAIWVQTKPSGASVTTTTTIDRATKIRTETADSNRSSVDAFTVNVNGLVVNRSKEDTTVATKWEFDGLGRPVKETSPLGEITRTTYRADGLIGTTTDHAGKVTLYDYYGPAHASAGKLLMTTDPLGKTRTYAYDALGNTTEEAGTATYKVTYEYDEYGQKKKMFTWRTVSSADATEWVYQPGTGLLKEKIYPDGNKTTYSYYDSGKLYVRTWARGVSTTYSYNGYGDVTGINYSDTTPDVTFSGMDRLGRPTSVSQSGVGSETISYHAGKGVQNARFFVTGHTILPGYGMRTTIPDSAGRPAGVVETSGSNATAVRTVSYSYDTSGRFGTLTDGIYTHVYGYHPNSSLVATILSKTSGTTWFRESRGYDTRNRLVGIRSDRMTNDTTVSAEISAHGYNYDELGRRVRNTFQDGSYWTYGYNDRSEVTSASRKNAAGVSNPYFAASYDYDGMGNRTSSTSPILGNHTYTPNQLNQYSTVTTGSYRAAVGRAPAAWTVQVYPTGTTVSAASRDGEFYYRDLSAANSSAPVWQSVVTRRSTGTPTTTTPWWYAKASVTPLYDLDGNLTNDGRWVYTWDAENRLIKMETTTAATTALHPFTRLTFVYDSQGRRIARHVWQGGTSGSPTFKSSRRWVYDGWNPIVEFSASSSTTTTVTRLNTYTWGLDLSGSLDGGGGVGGLLVQTTVSGTVTRRASYDGNGNIVAWTRSNQAAPDSRREYDAFGNTLVTEGSTVSEFGYSTKMQDQETGLYYYGYRYYDPNTGRWASRDPIEEAGGENLYAFISNRTLGTFDVNGLISEEEVWEKFKNENVNNRELLAKRQEQFAKRAAEHLKKMQEAATEAERQAAKKYAERYAMRAKELGDMLAADSKLNLGCSTARLATGIAVAWLATTETMGDATIGYITKKTTFHGRFKKKEGSESLYTSNKCCICIYTVAHTMNPKGGVSPYVQGAHHYIYEVGDGEECPAEVPAGAVHVGSN